MAEKKDPTTGTESDISKAQSPQQPPAQAQQQQESGEQDNQQFSQAEQLETGRTADQPNEGLKGETLAQQRTDVEGASLQKETGEAESGFVGAEGQQDTSSELVEDDEFDEGGESAPEGE